MWSGMTIQSKSSWRCRLVVKKKSFFKKPEIWKVAVEYGLNNKKIIEDWISDGCPCVWGNVENPFGEENGS